MFDTPTMVPGVAVTTVLTIMGGNCTYSVSINV